MINFGGSDGSKEAKLLQCSLYAAFLVHLVWAQLVLF